MLLLAAAIGFAALTACDSGANEEAMNADNFGTTDMNMGTDMNMSADMNTGMNAESDMNAGTDMNST